ncbi:hypothetical protein K431DRAFT_343567 [Polychaeton citri CBS 116435]|uniref:B-block binding subunit of TFIIIC domain-containing protein n=1 Tax=Polychaeton citri CBS 116435 TaxID=1314669 RepID=A0A9P4QGU0_9PEZI|nr:hypothetical protein K431DRAFT_343567 [Polychaeton citri CBS 116435]
MASGFDELIDQLLHDIALSGPNGLGIEDLKSFVKQFYKSRIHGDDSTTSAVLPQDLLFADAPPPTVMPTVDDTLVDKLWRWLSAYSDINVIQPPNHNQSPLANGHSTGQRLAATEERIWHAIAGHGVDYKRVFPLEFAVLSVIAAHGPSGIVQPDIVRLTGQDKRSVPKRTDSLVQKGYITKEAVIAQSSKTSLLKLKRYASQREKGAFAIDHQGNQARIIHYATWYNETIRLLQDNNNIMALDDVRKGLNINNKKWETRAYFRCIRRLARVGCIRRIKAEIDHGDEIQHSGGRSRAKYARCIQLLHPPTEMDRNAFTGNDGSANKPYADDESGDEQDAEGVPDDEIEGFEEDVENAGTQIAPNPPGMWIRDRSMINRIYSLVHEAGVAGVTSSEVVRRLGGSNFRRPLDELMSRLSEAWHISQPPHLRHFGLIRDVVTDGRRNVFRLRTRPNFELAVADGEASWDAIHDFRKINAKKGKKVNEVPPQPPPDMDKWGFPKIPLQNFALKDSIAPLASCVDLLQGQTGTGQNTVVRHSATTRKQRKPRKALAVDLSDSELLVQLHQKAQPKRGRPTKEYNVAQKVAQSEENDKPGEITRRNIPRSVKVDYEDLVKFKVSVRTTAEKLAAAEQRLAHIRLPSRHPSPSVVVPSLETGVRSMNKKRKADELGESPTPKKRGRPTKAMLAERDRLKQEELEREKLRQERRDQERLERERIEEEQREMRQLSESNASLATGKSRAIQIEHELLSRSRPGVYVQPPGARTLRLEEIISQGRRGVLPKAKVVVFKSERLEQFDWFQKHSHHIKSEYRIVPNEDGTWQSRGISLEGFPTLHHGQRGVSTPQEVDTPTDADVEFVSNDVDPRDLATYSIQDERANVSKQVIEHEDAMQFNAAAQLDDQYMAEGSQVRSAAKVTGQNTSAATKVGDTQASVGQGDDTSAKTAGNASVSKPKKRGRPKKVKPVNRINEAAQRPVEITSDIELSTKVPQSQEATFNQTSSRDAVEDAAQGEPNVAFAANLASGPSTQSNINARQASENNESRLHTDTFAESSENPAGTIVQLSTMAAPSETALFGTTSHESAIGTDPTASITDLQDNAELSDSTDTDLVGGSEITPEMFYLGIMPKVNPEDIGLVDLQRTRIVMDTMKRCNGVFPGSREMWYPLISAWKQKYSHSVDRQTSARAVGNLLALGQLQQFIFKWKAKSGTSVDIRILALPGISSNDPRVRKAKQGMKDRYPAKYLPTECYIDPDLRLRAENFRLPFQSRSSKSQTTLTTDQEQNVPIRKFGSWVEEFPLDSTLSVKRPYFPGQSPPPSPQKISTPSRKKTRVPAQRERRRLSVVATATAESRQTVSTRRRRSGSVIEHDSSDGDASGIDDEQVQMQGMFQIDDYAHDPEAKFERTHEKGKLSRLFRLKNDPPDLQKPSSRFQKLSSSRSEPTSLLVTRRVLDRLPRGFPVLPYQRPMPLPPGLDGMGRHYETIVNYLPSMRAHSSLDPKVVNINTAVSVPIYRPQDLMPPPTLLPVLGQPSSMHSPVPSTHYPQHINTQGSEPYLASGSGFTNTYAPAQQRKKIDLRLQFKPQAQLQVFQETSGIFGDCGLPTCCTYELPALAFGRENKATADNPDLPQSLEDVLERDPTHRRLGQRLKVADEAWFFEQVDSVQDWESHVVENDIHLETSNFWIFINHRFVGGHIRPDNEYADLASTIFGEKKFVYVDEQSVGSGRLTQDADQAIRSSATSYIPSGEVLRMGIPRAGKTSLAHGTWNLAPAGRKRKSNTLNVQGGNGITSAEPSNKKQVTSYEPRQRRRGPFEEADRLIAALALVGAVCGGIQQNINWSIVSHAFEFKYNEDFLESKWIWLRRSRADEVKMLQHAIMEPFLEAYEKDELPPINFNRPEDTDWPALLKWAERFVKPPQKSNSPEISSLPASRELLNNRYKIREADKPYEVSRESYFTQTFDTHRAKLAHTYVYGRALPGASSSIAKKDDALMLAKSWIKANCSTKQAVYDHKRAAAKLGLLGPLLDTALSELVTEGVLVQEKPHRQLPGRNFHFSTTFLRLFQRWPKNTFNIPERFYLRDAAAAWHHVVEQLSQNDSYAMSPIVRDSEMIALTSLLSAGRIKAVSHFPERNDHYKAPFPRLTSMSYTDGTYDAKKIDRARLRFPLTYHKTDKFSTRHGLKPGVSIPLQPHVFGKEEYTRLPFWVDINGNLIDVQWDLVLRSVMHVVVFRPGCTAKSIETTHDGKLWEWEVDMVLGWMEKTGIIMRWGPGSEDDGAWKGGWRTTEDWPVAFSPEIAVWESPQRDDSK